MGISLQKHLLALRRADRRYYTQRFVDLQRAVELAAAEAEKKNAELNDVRFRFIPREVFEQYRDEQMKRNRAVIVGFITAGLAIIALGLTLLGMLLRAAHI